MNFVHSDQKISTPKRASSYTSAFLTHPEYFSNSKIMNQKVTFEFRISHARKLIRPSRNSNGMGICSCGITPMEDITRINSVLRELDSGLLKC